MYALHEAGPTISALPPPFQLARPTDQLDPRAVEATARGDPETADRQNVLYSQTAAVLELVANSARDFARLMEYIESAEDSPPAESTPELPDRTVDVYA